MSHKNPSSPCRQDTFVGVGWEECQASLNEPASLGSAVLWWTCLPPGGCGTKVQRSLWALGWARVWLTMSWASLLLCTGASGCPLGAVLVSREPRAPSSTHPASILQGPTETWPLWGVRTNSPVIVTGLCHRVTSSSRREGIVPGRGQKERAEAWEKCE